MLVVADSSPINILVRIRCISLLGELFGTVLIPPEVRTELSDPKTPQEVRDFVDGLPPWMTVQPAAHIQSIPPLDRGEEAAISLALEVRADALLIDERDGRKAALARGVSIVGTVGVLERASIRGLIDLTEVFERLRKSDFRLDPRTIQNALARAADRKR